MKKCERCGDEVRKIVRTGLHNEIRNIAICYICFSEYRARCREEGIEIDFPEMIGSDEPSGQF
jgi:hypothetical protein